jgi:hypothetical protein
MWHITGMELWDDDYVNMERQAFVEIGPDNIGSFQFGLVRGGLDGYVEAAEGEPSDHRRDPKQLASDRLSDRFMFTWEGFDELDEVSGSGYMRVTGADEAVGLIKFHGGDRSTFYSVTSGSVAELDFAARCLPLLTHRSRRSARTAALGARWTRVPG